VWLIRAPAENESRVNPAMTGNEGGVDDNPDHVHGRPASVGPERAPAASPEIEDLSRPSNELTQRISPKTS
jgi:hypothetical protein